MGKRRSQPAKGDVKGTGNQPGPSLRARATLAGAAEKIDRIRVTDEPTLHDLADVMGDVVSALEDIRYDLYVTHRNVTDALDSMDPYGAMLDIPSPRTPSKTRKRRRSPLRTLWSLIVSVFVLAVLTALAVFVVGVVKPLYRP